MSTEDVKTTTNYCSNDVHRCHHVKEKIIFKQLVFFNNNTTMQFLRTSVHFCVFFSYHFCVFFSYVWVKEQNSAQHVVSCVNYSFKWDALFRALFLNPWPTNRIGVFSKSDQTIPNAPNNCFLLYIQSW